MWVNKQHGIMPNQYHHFYENGDTMIYPEHIQDLIVIDRMYTNKLEKERKKQEGKNSANNPLKQTGFSNKIGGFYSGNRRRR